MILGDLIDIEPRITILLIKSWTTYDTTIFIYIRWLLMRTATCRVQRAPALPSTSALAVPTLATVARSARRQTGPGTGRCVKLKR